VCEAFLGNPWRGVCDYAERQGIDLVVIATHGRTGLQHALIGSTAEKIVRHAPCPVLVVKAEEKDFVTD
jgi:nucleotide-binding universal stress UspA family protein